MRAGLQQLGEDYQVRAGSVLGAAASFCLLMIVGWCWLLPFLLLESSTGSLPMALWRLRHTPLPSPTLCLCSALPPQKNKSKWPYLIYRETPMTHDKDASKGICLPAPAGGCLLLATSASYASCASSSSSSAAAAAPAAPAAAVCSVITAPRLDPPPTPSPNPDASAPPRLGVRRADGQAVCPGLGSLRQDGRPHPRRPPERQCSRDPAELRHPHRGGLLLLGAAARGAHRNAGGHRVGLPALLQRWTARGAWLGFGLCPPAVCSSSSRIVPSNTPCLLGSSTPNNPFTPTNQILLYELTRNFKTGIAGVKPLPPVPADQRRQCAAMA